MVREPMDQSELEDLSAFLDGELPPQRAAEVEALIRSDPRWAAAQRELNALDAILDAYAAPPAPADLAGRIIRRSRKLGRPKPLVIRLVRWIAPAAAAAAVILIAAVALRRGPTRTQVSPKDALADVPKADRFVVENLSFFRDYEVIENLETLKAIERLDDKDSGT